MKSFRIVKTLTGFSLTRFEGGRAETFESLNYPLAMAQALRQAGYKEHG